MIWVSFQNHLIENKFFFSLLRIALTDNLYTGLCLKFSKTGIARLESEGKIEKETDEKDMRGWVGREWLIRDSLEWQRKMVP